MDIDKEKIGTYNLRITLEDSFGAQNSYPLVFEIQHLGEKFAQIIAQRIQEEKLMEISKEELEEPSEIDDKA